MPFCILLHYCVKLSFKEWGNCNLSRIHSMLLPQAASLPMSVIIVGVGPAEFDGKYLCVTWKRGCAEYFHADRYMSETSLFVSQIQSSICFFAVLHYVALLKPTVKTNLAGAKNIPACIVCIPGHKPHWFLLTVYVCNIIQFSTWFNHLKWSCSNPQKMSASVHPRR